jgi:hypothetical protein
MIQQKIRHQDDGCVDVEQECSCCWLSSLGCRGYTTVPAAAHRISFLTRDVAKQRPSSLLSKCLRRPSLDSSGTDRINEDGNMIWATAERRSDQNDDDDDWVSILWQNTDAGVLIGVNASLHWMTGRRLIRQLTMCRDQYPVLDPDTPGYVLHPCGTGERNPGSYRYTR